MKGAKTLSLVFVFSLSFAHIGHTQEYDDLYFTKRDRQKFRELHEIKRKKNETISSMGNPSFQNRSSDQKYATRKVRSESSPRYKRGNITDPIKREEQQPKTSSFGGSPETLPRRTIDNNSFGNPYVYRSYSGYPRNFGTSFSGLGMEMYSPFGYSFSPFYNDLRLYSIRPPFYSRYYSLAYRPFFGSGIFYSRYSPYLYDVPIRVETGLEERTVRRKSRDRRGGSVISSSGRSRSATRSSNETRRRLPSSVQRNRDASQKQAIHPQKTRRGTRGRIYNSRTNTPSGTRNSTGSGVYNAGSRSRSVPSYNGKRLGTGKKYPSRTGSGSGRSRGTGRGNRN